MSETLSDRRLGRGSPDAPGGTAPASVCTLQVRAVFRDVDESHAETLAADPRHRGHWQAVLARAVADMTELAELALPLLQIGGLLVAWKRQPINDELARADSAIHQLRGRLIRLQPVVVPGLEDHVLVVVEKVAETPREFPRDPAARHSRPL